MSRTERSKRPSSFAKIRRRATTSARRAASSSRSSSATPSEDEQAGADLSPDAGRQPAPLPARRAGSRPSCRPALSPIYGPWKLRRFRRAVTATSTAGPRAGHSSARSCLRDGVITPGAASRRRSRRRRRKAAVSGEILLRYSITTATAIARALAQQYGLRVCRAEPLRPGPGGHELAARERGTPLSALPIGFDEDEDGDRRRHRPDRRDGLRRPPARARPPDPLRRRLGLRPGPHAGPLGRANVTSRWKRM